MLKLLLLLLIYVFAKKVSINAFVGVVVRGCSDRTLCVHPVCRVESVCIMESIIEVNEFEGSDDWEDFEDWFPASSSDEDGYVVLSPASCANSMDQKFVIVKPPSFADMVKRHAHYKCPLQKLCSQTRAGGKVAPWFCWWV